MFQLYLSPQFHWWWKLEYPKKITNLSQVADKNNDVSSTPRKERNSNALIPHVTNYQMIVITTAPNFNISKIRMCNLIVDIF